MKKTKYRKSKIVTWILFILTTLTITYESLVSEEMSLINQLRILSNRIVETLNPVEVVPVEGIEILSPSSVQAGSRFNFEYRVLPENATDKSVVVTNLTPDVITLKGTNNQVITDNKLEAPYARTAQIEVKSKSNENIKVVHSFEVVKYKPESIYVYKTNLDFVSGSTSTYEANINEDIYLEFRNDFLDSSLEQHLAKFTIVTSDNIKELNSHYYYATKPGDAYIKAISQTDPNIIKEVKFRISDVTTPQVLPDEIKFKDKKGGEYESITNPLVRHTYDISLFKDGELVKVPFLVKSNDSNNFYVNSRTIEFFNNGLCKLDFYLPTFDEHIYKEFYVHHIFKDPTFIVEEDFDEETMTLGVEVSSANTINLNWPTEATGRLFKIENGNNRYFDVTINGSTITVRGKEAGSSSFYLVSKQNESSNQEGLRYKINVNVRKAFITDQDSFDLIIRKSFGHMLGFLIDGFLLGLLIYLYRSEGKFYLWMLITLPVGFVLAGTSELLQMIPKRGTSLKDVGIDFFGWFNGVLLIYLIICIIYLVKYLYYKIKNK